MKKRVKRKDPLKVPPEVPPLLPPELSALEKFSEKPVLRFPPSTEIPSLGESMAFIDWSSLKTAILNDIADGSILTKAYSIGNRSRTFRDLSDVMEFLRFIDMQIGAVSGGKTAYASFKRPGGGA